MNSIVEKHCCAHRTAGFGWCRSTRRHQILPFKLLWINTSFSKPLKVTHLLDCAIKRHCVSGNYRKPPTQDAAQTACSEPELRLPGSVENVFLLLPSWLPIIFEINFPTRNKTHFQLWSARTLNKGRTPTGSLIMNRYQTDLRDQQRPAPEMTLDPFLSSLPKKEKDCSPVADNKDKDFYPWQKW